MSKLWRWACVGCFLAACQVDRVTQERFDCTGDRQCADNFTCHDNVCTAGPILDAAAEPEPEPDSGDAAVPDPADADVQDATVNDGDGDGFDDDMDNCPAVANDQADLDGDGLGDSCDDDRDGDGVLNANDGCPSVPNPEQKDRNGNGEDDACEIECAAPGLRCTLRKATCTVREACGAGFTIFEYEGTCGERWCGDFVEPAREVMGGGCGQQEICKPDPQTPCVPIEVCPSDIECTPERDGAPCVLDGEPQRGARCVDAACRAWDCVAPECNEPGARRYSLNESWRVVLVEQGRPEMGIRFIQLGPQLQWAFPGREPLENQPAPPSSSLIDAHRRCSSLVHDGHEDWRLPTMHELHGLSVFDDPFDAFLQVIRTNALFFSRTVIGDAEVMAVTLVNAVASPIPIEGIDAQVACVRATAPAVRDLTARRRNFTDWRVVGSVPDPHTGLLWNDPGVRRSYQDAREACDAMGASLPSINALATLLTFNSGPALPAPGSWLAFDEGRAQPSNLRVWSFETTPVEGEHLHLNFRTGEVSAVQDVSPLDVLCVFWPDLEEPGE